MSETSFPVRHLFRAVRDLPAGPCILTLVVLLLLSACDESVNPIIESDRNYTLFGVLDMGRDTQFVRVIPIRSELESESQTPPDVVFTSEDLTNGSKLTWQDSVIVFPNSSVGYVYYIPMRVLPGHTYRIEVIDHTTGIVTSAETTAPDLPEAVILPDTVQGSATSGGIIRTGSQKIIWRGIDRKPYRIEQWYRFLPASDGSPFVDVLLPYEPPNKASTGESNAWEVNLELHKDRLALDTLLSVPSMALAGLGMQIVVLDPDYAPPGGVFDPEILVQPGTMTNVENGFGFIGSAGRFGIEWVLSKHTQEVLNYRTMEEVFGKRAEELLRSIMAESQVASRVRLLNSQKLDTSGL